VGEQMSYRGWAPARLGRDQPVGPQIVVGGSIKVEQSAFPQLHDGNGGKGLGDGADPKDRVLSHRCRGLNVCEPVTREELQRSVADHTQCQADRRPAVQDPIDTAIYLKLIDPWHRKSLSMLVGDSVDSLGRIWPQQRRWSKAS